jgi:hypothetical protein
LRGSQAIAGIHHRDRRYGTPPLTPHHLHRAMRKKSDTRRGDAMGATSLSLSIVVFQVSFQASFARATK